MRASRETDFTKNVEGIGTFRFGRRGLRDEFAINAEYKRLTEGLPPVEGGDIMDTMASAVAALTVLTVEAPDGWDLDEFDPFDEDAYVKLLKVWGALREQERSFRRNRAGREADRTGAGGVDAGVVPPNLQPRAD